MKKINRIAFIDDDEFSNSYHKKLAENSGISKEVIFFKSTCEAVDYLGNINVRREFPQLIFIDIKLHGKEDCKLVSDISELPCFDPYNTVIAFLTDSPNIEEVLRSEENNIELYFWKPLKQDVLERIVVEHF